MEVTTVFVFSSYQDYHLPAYESLSHVASLKAKNILLRRDRFTPATNYDKYPSPYCADAVQHTSGI